MKNRDYIWYSDLPYKIQYFFIFMSNNSNHSIFKYQDELFRILYLYGYK